MTKASVHPRFGVVNLDWAKGGDAELLHHVALKCTAFGAVEGRTFSGRPVNIRNILMDSDWLSNQDTSDGARSGSSINWKPDAPGFTIYPRSTSARRARVWRRVKQKPRYVSFNAGRLGGKRCRYICFHESPKRNQHAVNVARVAKSVIGARMRGASWIVFCDGNMSLRAMMRRLGAKNGVSADVMMMIGSRDIVFEDIEKDKFGKVNELTNHNILFATVRRRKP